MATTTRWLRPWWRLRRSVRDQTKVVLVFKRSHLSQDPIAPLRDIARRPIGMQTFRVWQHRGEERCLGRRQSSGGRMKELLRRRLDPIDPGSELHDVEIGLEDALFRPQHLEQYREPRLQSLAQVASAWPQKQILRQLL